MDLFQSLRWPWWQPGAGDLLVGYLVLSTSWCIVRAAASRLFRNSPGSVALVVTGCDSGFGMTIARRMASQGSEVFAGCLTQEGVDSLEGENRLHPFLLDVTDQASVAAAVGTVSAQLPQGMSLVLLNNAGVMCGGAIDFSLAVDDLTTCLAVNTIGAARMAEGLVHLIRERHGRIINVASVCGKISLSQLGGYSASKFAVEALSDAWRRDLRVWGIPVSVIEPGTTAGTALWQASITDAHVDATWSKLPPGCKKIYRKEHLVTLRDESKNMLNLLSGPPNRVILTMEEAILSPWPKARYPVGLDTMLLSTVALLPDMLSDALFALTMPTLHVKPVEPKQE